MKTKLTILFALICSMSTFAQVKETEISTRSKKGFPKLIKFNETKVSDDPQAVKIFLRSLFQSDNQTEFKTLKERPTNELGYKSVKLQQYYKGVKVEFATFNVRSKNGELTSTTGEYVNIQDLDVQPKLTEDVALQFALKNIGAKEYFWENQETERALKIKNSDEEATYFPKGELVVFNLDSSKPILTYKFKIDAIYPYSNDIVYVNANTGKVELKNSLIRFISGPADTRYSGQQNIETTLSGGQYVLRDNTRGNGIHVFNLRGQGSYLWGYVDIVDNDNYWTSAEFDNSGKDNAALDVLWGAEKTHDYFLSYHNRNGIDDQGFKINHHVHGNLSSFNPNFNNDNAFWSDGNIVYGDGENIFDAVTSLDIVAHEIGHGLFVKALDIQSGANSGEPGAINEGLSDIWGAMVEYYMAGTDPNKNTYLIGEEIHLNNVALRSMSNPKLLGHPDTYGGTYWIDPNSNFDNGGIHRNNGVLNHWFYLLAEGSSATDGINDNGDAFNLQGIGKFDAANIVYKTLISGNVNEYVDFQEIRDYTILAAEEWYGINSIEAIAVNNAWYAVGLGNAINVDYQLTGEENTCYNDATTLTLTNVTNKAVTWQVSSNIQIVQSNNSSITVKALNNTTRAMGYVTANVDGQQVTKDVWVGKTNSALQINGPTTVLYGALVNYSTSASIPGATSYQWYLPSPFNPNATAQPNPPEWGIITGGNSRYLTAIVGPNNGLVQVMGVNKCGVGSSKSLSVTIGSPGDKPPGGGGIPLTLNGGSSASISVYPNPVSNEFIVSLTSNTKSSIRLYDANGKLILTKETNQFSEIIKTTNLLNGVYFLQIKGETNAIKKIIVKH